MSHVPSPGRCLHFERVYSLRNHLYVEQSLGHMLHSSVVPPPQRGYGYRGRHRHGHGNRQCVHHCYTKINYKQQKVFPKITRIIPSYGYISHLRTFCHSSTLFTKGFSPTPTPTAAPVLGSFELFLFNEDCMNCERDGVNNGLKLFSNSISGEHKIHIEKRLISNNFLSQREN